LKEYGGSRSGTIEKRSSFFLNLRRDSIDNGSIINAMALDPVALRIISPFTETPRTPPNSSLATSFPFDE